MPDGSVSDGSPQGRPVRILLYTLIPADSELQPIVRTPLERLRNRLRRGFDLAAWGLTGQWRAHYFTFEDRFNSNRGDIAIRVGVERQLARAFAGRPLIIDEAPWNGLGAALAGAEPYDLVVIGGGGYLFADPEGRLSQRFAADVEALSRTAAPVAAASIGLNHLITGQATARDGAFRFHPDQSRAIRAFLDRADLVSVRDEATRRALEAAVPTARDIDVVVDPAFLLVSTFDEERRRLRSRAIPGAPLNVGLNIAFHGVHATMTNRHLLRQTIQALGDFAAATPCRFTYFVHSDSERAIAQILRRAGLALEIVEGDVDVMLTAYKKLDLHVGQMLHSCILATSAGVPTLGIAYDTKSAAFFNLLGLPEWCIDAVGLDRHGLLAALSHLMQERQRVAGQIAVRGASLRTEAAGFYRRLGELVVEPITQPAKVAGRPA